jgi:hypothetical protein
MSFHVNDELYGDAIHNKLVTTAPATTLNVVL